MVETIYCTERYQARSRRVRLLPMIEIPARATARAAPTESSAEVPDAMPDADAR